MAQPIIPLIMCGGAGTRLWPASRENRPKQFLPLFGPLSTFQETMRRVSDPALFGRPIVVTNGQYRFLVAEQLAAIGAEADVLLEPARRDSGPAIVAGATYALRRATIRWSSRLPPTTSSPIRPRSPRSARRPAPPPRRIGSSCSASSRRAPPPNTATSGPARRSLQACSRSKGSSKSPTPRPRRAIWPRAICGTRATSCFARASCSTNITASSRKAPPPSRPRSKAPAADLGFVTLDVDAFSRAAAKSIDYAVMERTERAAVMPVSYGWSDVGSWQAVWELSERDAAGNAAHGPAVFVDTRGSYVATDKQLVALLGLDNVVVVTTADAVLVARREASDGLRRVVGSSRRSRRR